MGYGFGSSKESYLKRMTIMATPTATERMVTVSPTFRNWKNPIWTVSLESSITIMLATEPTMVRFPAKVLDMANTSHMTEGSENLSIHWLARMT